MKKIWKIIMLGLLAFSLIIHTVLATDADNGEEPKIDVETPKELAEYLPFDFDQMNASEIQNAFDFRFFSETGVRILVEAVPDAAKSFALLLGLFLTVAVLYAVRGTLSVPALQTAIEIVSMICMAGAIFEVTETAFGFAESYIDGLSSFMKRVTPTMAGFMAASGSFTFASVMTGVIFLAVSLLETVVANVLFPLIRLSLCLSVISTVFQMQGVGGISSYIRKIISYIFGFITLCLSAVLMFQSVIAKSTDSIAMRGIKFAVGNFIPFVGGAVNEALSTVIGGLGKIKAVTGVVGAVIVCLLAAVPVIRILLHKMFLELLSFIAGLLGLGNETRLMTEVSAFFGYTAAIMAISAVFFILSLSMMASS
jgi:stage III sporulation protein AE